MTGRIECVFGDITEQSVDAIVNAANPGLLGGGGVDGAIHRKGGPTILRACRALRASVLEEGLPVGQAVATGAGDLPCKWVIHAVGPVYQRSGSLGPSNCALDLAACHRSSLLVARALGAETVAFPAISTGIYGYPVGLAAPIAISTVKAALADLPWIKLVRFVLFDEATLEAFESAMVST